MALVDGLRNAIAATLRDRPSRRTLFFAAALLLLLGLLLVIPPLDVEAPGRLPAFGDFDGEPMVRVLLTAADLHRGVDLGPGALRIITPRARHALPEGRWRLRVERGTLHVGSLTLELPARLVAASGETLRLGTRHYEGALDVVPQDDRALLVNRVPLERYVAGVIMEEMGASFPDEALVAQAVCARSYAVSRMQTRRGRSYDLRDDQRSQVYRGVPAPRKRAERLAGESRGWVLVHEGALLPAYYSSTCGGWTRAAGEAFGGKTLPPLAGAPCGACEDSPRHTWSVRCDVGTAARRLGLDASSLSIGRLEHRDSGRLDKVTLSDRNRSVTVGVTSLRRALGGRTHSTWITSIERAGDSLTVKGRGFGHGVGLCQYGARTLAWAGLDAAAILARYFPGATLATIYADVSD